MSLRDSSNFPSGSISKKNEKIQISKVKPRNNHSPARPRHSLSKSLSPSSSSVGPTVAQLQRKNQKLQEDYQKSQQDNQILRKKLYASEEEKNGALNLLSEINNILLNNECSGASNNDTLVVQRLKQVMGINIKNNENLDEYQAQSAEKSSFGNKESVANETPPGTPPERDNEDNKLSLDSITEGVSSTGERAQGNEMVADNDTSNNNDLSSTTETEDSSCNNSSSSQEQYSMTTVSYSTTSEESSTSFTLQAATAQANHRSSPSISPRTRRTMAVDNGRKLLTAPKLCLTSTPSDESYVPSSSNVSSEVSQLTTDVDDAVIERIPIKSKKHNATKQIVNEATVGVNSENNDNSKSNNKAEMSIDNNHIDNSKSTIFYESDTSCISTNGRPPRGKKKAGKSRRRTMAIHKDTLLLSSNQDASTVSNDEQDDDDGKVTTTKMLEKEESIAEESNNDENDLNDLAPAKSNIPSEAVQQAQNEIKALVEATPIGNNDTKTSICYESDTSATSIITRQQKKGKSRRRRTLAIDGEKLLLASSPTPSTISEQTSTEISKNTYKKVIVNVGKESHVIPMDMSVCISGNNIRKQKQNILETPQNRTMQQLRRSRRKSFLPATIIDDAKNGALLSASKTEGIIKEESRDNLSSIPEKLPTSEIPKLPKRDIIDATPCSVPMRCVDDTVGSNGLITFDSENNRPAKKGRKKRRSSVGIGSFTAQEFEGLMNETKSLTARKRVCRNHEGDQQQSKDNVTVVANVTDSNSSNSIKNSVSMQIEESILASNKKTMCEIGEEITMAAACGSDIRQEEKIGMEIQVEQLPKITGPVLRERIRTLFPETLSMNCVSSRILSCFTLYAETLMVVSTSVSVTRTRSFQHLQPIMTLLEKIVHAESTSVGATGNDAVNMNRSKKRVSFFSADYSATKPPVDSVTGSNSEFEDNVRALHAAVHEFHNICKSYSRSDQKTRDEIKDCLIPLIRLLKTFENASGEGLRDVCSESMPLDYPSERFIKAAELYRHDFEYLLASLNSHELMQSDSCLVLESRLGDFIGRGVRFYLRRFFNTIPLPLTTDTEVDASVRTGIHEIIEMAAPDNSDLATAIADGSISSIFSSCLRCIYNYFGPDFLTEEFSFDNMNFFNSKASQRGVGKKGESVVISSEDLATVLSDINESNVFLAAANACRFLSELLSWPGVKEEIDSVGGWSAVEEYGKTIELFRLERACPEDAYFVLLGNVTLFTRKAKQCWDNIKETVSNCESGRNDLWKRFRCGTRSKSTLQLNPCIKEIASELKDVSMFTFPLLQATG